MDTMLSILFEDNHLIAVNKAWSDIVQGDRTGDVPLSNKVADYLKQTYRKPGNAFVGVIHRLDRPTSGVVLFAKTSKALSRMNGVFRDGEVAKKYWALLGMLPEPPEGRLVHDLVRNRKLNKSFVPSAPRKDSRSASLTYKVIQSLDRYHAVEIVLETGRHHQIRAQFAAKNWWIKGDLKYGAPRSNQGGGIHLHARSLKFVHPVTHEEITIIADPPAEVLWDLIDR